MSIALRVMAVAYVIGYALGALLAPVAAPVATPAPASATPASATPAAPVVARKPARHESRMVDCEDMDVQPCVTLDEGRWRMVWSYRPYASTPVHACKPSHLVRPCLVTRPTTEGTYRWLW